ncbi:MAG: glycosyltransferase family 1 protein [Chitinophagaceae bacterium]|nr:MAG: glycosyltransferase family 1 protein [Chitinophagaceae bacterium]
MTDKKLLKVCLTVSKIPPVYSGAGKRAYRHGQYLASKNMLFSLITKTREESVKDNSDIKNNLSKYIYRFTTKRKRNNKILALSAIIYHNFRIFIFLTKNRKQVDLIHTFSNSWEEIGTILFSKIFGKPLLREFTLLPDFDKKSSHWSQKHILKFNLNNATTIICISNALQDWCKINNIKTKTVVIHNDTDFKPGELSKAYLKETILGEKFKERYPVLLFLGPKSFRKGFDIAIESFDILLKNYPEALMILLGISEKKPIINGKQYNLEKYLNNETIIDKGLVSDPERFFQMADITIFPSRREGFGNVLIESMAVGVPVIARNLKGITDHIIENGETGFLIYEGDDPNSYYEKMNLLLSNSEVYKSMSMKGINKINNEFTHENIMNKYVELYSKTIANK